MGKVDDAVRYITRRACLTAASVAVVAGCGRVAPPWERGGSAFTLSIADRIWNAIVPQGLRRGIQAAAREAFPSVRIGFMPIIGTPPAGSRTSAVIVPVGGTESILEPSYLLPLDMALRTLNTPLPALVQRMLPQFEVSGTIRALPEFLFVSRLVVKRSVMGSGWVSPKDWTLGQFVGVVADVARVVRSEPALGGDFSALVRAGAAVPAYVWLPFVLGFGGSVDDITGSRAVSGLTALCTLLHDYGAGFEGAVSLVGGPVSSASGMFGTDPYIVPYPRMPVVAVLPYTAIGWGIWPEGVGDPSAEVVSVATRFLVWMYGQVASHLVAKWGWWSAGVSWDPTQPVGAFSRGDLVDVGRSASATVQRVETVVGPVLQQAVRNPTVLLRALEAAVRAV
jgi:hypothetical protein